MNKKVLITTQMMMGDQARFAAELASLGCDAEFIKSEQYLREQEALNLQPVYDGWIAGDDEITAKVIDRLTPRLKVIAKWGTGLDSINVTYAESQGVAVRNTKAAFSDAVGEMAIAYLLALTRNILVTDQQVRAGGWPKAAARTLKEMQVGILGMGAIGSGAADRLKLLGSEVSYFDPNVNALSYEKVGNVNDLFEICDAVIICAPLNEGTRGLVNRAILERSKKGLLLINVARGPIVCEADLVWSLKEGIVFAAALDVFQEEPLPYGSELRSLERVILGSHNANNTVMAVESVHAATISSLHMALAKRDADEELGK